MKAKICKTYWAKIYLSGPIEHAKQIIRADCLREPRCFTIEPTTFIYPGGEEAGYMVELINYPRFKVSQIEILKRGRDLALKLISGTFQRSALLMTPDKTEWITRREQ